MVLKRLGCVFMLLTALSLCAGFTAAGNDDLTGSVEAYLVVKNDAGQEDFKAAATAHPDDVIEYRLTYLNSGETPVKNISLVDPVPYGMKYIPVSASAPAGGLVEFSIDKGKSYHQWPVKVLIKDSDGKEKMHEATPDMITHVRWVLEGMLVPESVVTVSYRATVK